MQNGAKVKTWNCSLMSPHNDFSNNKKDYLTCTSSLGCTLHSQNTDGKTFINADKDRASHFAPSL